MSKILCSKKWMASTIHCFDSTVSSCCLHKPTYISNLNNFHNINKNIKDRQDMLSGKWPEECYKYCGEIEHNGGQSLRNFYNTIEHPDYDNIKPNVLDVEIYFDNICNLACVYCKPRDSSKIELENKKFGEFKIKNIFYDEMCTASDNKQNIKDEFFKWLTENYKTIKRLSIIGGEPLFQPEFKQVLTFFENNKAPELILSITTNLMISKIKLQDFINQWRNILKYNNLKRIDINVSIDCWGEEQEYVRQGINLNQFEENFKLLLNNKWLRLSINHALTVLTVNSMPVLLKKINKWKINRKISQTISPAYNSEYMNPLIMGDKFSNTWIEILELIDDSNFDGKFFKNNILGYYNASRLKKINDVELKKLQIYLDELDNRRNTNWRKIFPYLDII